MNLVASIVVALATLGSLPANPVHHGPYQWIPFAGDARWDVFGRTENGIFRIYYSRYRGQDRGPKTTGQTMLNATGVQLMDNEPFPGTISGTDAALGRELAEKLLLDRGKVTVSDGHVCTPDCPGPDCPRKRPVKPKPPEPDPAFKFQPVHWLYVAVGVLFLLAAACFVFVIGSWMVRSAVRASLPTEMRQP